MCLEVHFVPNGYMCVPVWKVITPLFLANAKEPTYFKTPYRDQLYIWKKQNLIELATSDFTLGRKSFIELRGECVHSYRKKPEVIPNGCICVPALAVGVLGWNRRDVGSFSLWLGETPRHFEPPLGFEYHLAQIQVAYKEKVNASPALYQSLGFVHLGDESRGILSEILG